MLTRKQTLSLMTFRTRTQAILFETVVKVGTLPDSKWREARAIVGEPGRNFSAPKLRCSLYFANIFLGGDRMLTFAKLVLAFPGATSEEVAQLEDKRMVHLADTSKGYWKEVANTVARYGGAADIDSRLATIEYDSYSLYQDLGEMTEAMYNQEEQQ